MNESNARECDGPENSQAAASFDAVQRAVEDKGLERVSQDDIIRYSGIARTTLYRRYGSREAILNAFVLERTAPDIAECRRIATGARSFSERFEDILVFAILVFAFPRGASPQLASATARPRHSGKG